MQVSVNELNQNTNRWIERAEQSRDCVVVTTDDGHAKAVLIGMEAFESLLGILSTTHTPMPVAELQRDLRQALADAGYHTREDMVELVRDVRREIAAERAERKALRIPLK